MKEYLLNIPATESTKQGLQIETDFNHNASIPVGDNILHIWTNTEPSIEYNRVSVHVRDKNSEIYDVEKRQEIVNINAREISIPENALNLWDDLKKDLKKINGINLDILHSNVYQNPEVKLTRELEKLVNLIEVAGLNSYREEFDNVYNYNDQPLLDPKKNVGGHFFLIILQIFCFQIKIFTVQLVISHPRLKKIHFVLN